MSAANQPACYPELGNALLVCATEIHTEEDRDTFVKAFEQALKG